MKKIHLSRYLKPYLIFTILAPIFMAGEVIIDLLQPKLMAKIVNEGVLGKDVPLIITTGLEMLVLVMFGGAFGILCCYCASVASQGFGNDLRKDAFNRVMNLSLQQADKFTTGSLVTRLTNDITALQELVMMILRMFVRAPLFLIGGLVMCLSLNVSFGYVMLVSIPLQLILVLIILTQANPLFLSVQKKLDRVNTVVGENVSGVRVIKAYTREDYEIARFDKANKDYRDTNLRVMNLVSFVSPLLSIIMNLSVIAIIYIGGLQVEAQAMDVGNVMAAAQYITRVLMSIMMVSMMFQNLSRGKACAGRVCEVLASDPAILGGSNTDSDKAGIIEFENVSFAYPNSSGQNVLCDIDLKIARGETVAVIGATGCGKSTLTALIPHFYEATEGCIKVDGVDVRNWDNHALRSKIGYVLQKAELFSGTVSENIRWGKKDASDEEILRAAKIAQADEFVSTMSDGYNSYVAEKGASLSGGQKQRLAIARAILRDPEILIFDDSTSALDLATEAKLHAALRENLKDTTVIMIAQRIASVMNADKIAVLENGRITAYGKHDELMKTSSTYRDIYDSQMRSQNGEEANGNG